MNKNIYAQAETKSALGMDMSSWLFLFLRLDAQDLI